MGLDASGALVRLLTATGAASNNGTKSTPALAADILGDWREEVIWRAEDNESLRIYTTTVPAADRFYTLMHDPQYRMAIAWQNVGYNQPPHPSFFIGRRDEAAAASTHQRARAPATLSRRGSFTIALGILPRLRSRASDENIAISWRFAVRRSGTTIASNLQEGVCHALSCSSASVHP